MVILSVFWIKLWKISKDFSTRGKLNSGIVKLTSHSIEAADILLLNFERLSVWEIKDFQDKNEKTNENYSFDFHNQLFIVSFLFF